MDENELDEFIDDAEELVKEGASYRQERSAAQYKELRGRRGQELELWHHWDAQGRKPEHLEPILESMRPIIQREATKRLSGLGGSIPRAALEGSLRLATVRALETYDPTRIAESTGKPVQLTTHVFNNFQRITEFVGKHRNERKIPKAKVDRYAELKNAKNAFNNEFGRDPNTNELHSMLPRWKRKEIEELERSFAPTVFTNMGTELENDVGSASSQHWGAVQLMRSRFNDEEKRFAELHYPPTGRRAMTVEQIARAMNIPVHKAYRLRSRVDSQIAPLVKGE